ncbi:MAG: GHMP kinase [Verrucomicrobia bacterium]|nr:GHMP kinase [Verrucomicrobiota bacterium]
MKIFVPGRICLFGEHSDWAGGYRRINAEISKGYAVIAGTNQGVHAEVKPHPSKFIFRAVLDDGTEVEPFELPMEREALLEAAEGGGFISYAAGVAYQVLTHYRVRGLEITNTLTDLPVKKGLSSSAAVCVLVARAFNRIYDLKLTVRGEMELAYMGEITTPSRCGRLDQGCAYGNRPILMQFDGDLIDVKEISVPQDLHFILVDLMASKDTKEILNRLNHCYPFAEDDIQRNVQQYLGPINQDIVDGSVAAIAAGDARRLGELMQKAQSAFDANMQPACPSQLTAPALHRVLNHKALQPYIYGGKGVGSQGDGTAQFIARDRDAQKKAIEIIERDLKLPWLELVIRSGRRGRKAVIPAAGFGTRLFPATKAVKKELFPVVDGNGRAKPVILSIVEEALSAGIEEVCIIVQSQDRDLFEEVFCTPPAIENFNKLSKEHQKYCEHLMDIGNRITFLSQDTQDGFGHAVHCTKDWVGGEPFLLLLGDHLYTSRTTDSCARQLINAYESVGQSVVGVEETAGKDVRHFGCVTGTWKDDNHTLQVSEFAEKPDHAYASEHLQIEGMNNDTFLTVFGQYVLTPKVFDFLDEHIRLNIRERGEFQLTSCLDRVRKEEGFSACRVDGQRHDIGNPQAYIKTLATFAQQPTEG